MARIGINTGSAANDNTGSTLRAAGGIINDNFLEIYTYLGAGSTTTLSAPVWNTTNAGINTLRNVGVGTTNPRFTLEVGAVGASGTTLFVNGDARITGIVTIGTSSITLNGSSNTINVGTGITINGSTGIISATSIVVGGTTLTGAAVTSITAGSGISVDQSTGNVTITATGGGGSSQWVTTGVGIHTLSNVGIGTTNPTSTLTVTGSANITGVVTATTFIGALTGTASNVTTNANLTGDVTSTGNATSIAAGVIVDADINASAAIALSKLATSGILTATSFIGDGSGLTGVVGSGSGVIIRDSGSLVGTAGTIDFGDNLTVSPISAGIVTVTATGGGSSQFVTTSVGIHTLSNVGVGTTNPTSALTVTGNGIFTGVITATTFVGALTGTATTATLATNAQGLTGTPDITVNKIVAGLTSSIIPFYWENFSDLPSFSTYHGAFAHVHGTGKAYYAHTRWVELVNKEANGTVGTGTEYYNIGVATATTFVGALTGTATTATNLADAANITTGTINSARLSGTYNIDVSYASTAGIATNAQGLTGTPNITVGAINGSSINVSGISTLGTVKISSGIVTATSGTVTYYGDTSNTTDGRWTLGANGTSDYTFTGIGFTQTTNDPVLYLARGRVYEFVNNSGGSHPFQIRLSNGGAAYSDGVTNNGSASGTIRFEVPFNAPNTLYYQCTVHSGMGNTINVYPTTI